MLKIDRHIPPPRKMSVREPAHPWRALTPGDSILIECHTAQGRKNARSLAYVTAARLGIEVTTRVEDGSVRVWRIS